MRVENKIVNFHQKSAIYFHTAYRKQLIFGTFDNRIFMKIGENIKNYFFSQILNHLDNLEPALGRPAPELEVKTLKMVMF